MAIDDLEALQSELPEVFQPMILPPGWEKDWTFVPITREAPGLPVKRRAALAALSDYVKGCPPGYRLGVDVARRFPVEQREFAEQNHQEALPHLPKKRAHLWTTFSYAIAGIARRISRVNDIVHRSSSLAHRLPADLRRILHDPLGCRSCRPAWSTPVADGLGAS